MRGEKPYIVVPEMSFVLHCGCHIALWVPSPSNGEWSFQGLSHDYHMIIWRLHPLSTGGGQTSGMDIPGIRLKPWIFFLLSTTQN